MDINVSKSAMFTSISRNIIERIFIALRKRVVALCEQESPLIGTAAADPGKEHSVFGVVWCDGKVYTLSAGDSVIQNRSHAEIHFGNKQCRLYHLHEHSALITDIEEFWRRIYRRFLKFHAMDVNKFIMHLKECEYRFNHRDDDLYPVLLNLCEAQPLFAPEYNMKT